MAPCLHDGVLLRCHRPIIRILPTTQRPTHLCLGDHAESLPRNRGGSGPNLAKTIANLKKFTAHEILKQIKLERREWLLNQLAYFRAAHKLKSDHQVWQEGIHPQSMKSDRIMLQKLQYLHNNPVRYGFVASPEHWRYSSAHEWLPGASPVMRVDPWGQQEGATELRRQVRSQTEFGNESSLTSPKKSSSYCLTTLPPKWLDRR